VIILSRGSADPARPFANLLPLVTAIVERGNAVIGGGFVLNPDGWRCRMREPLDFDLISDLFILPANVHLAPDHDTVLDRLTWCSIEGPGAAQ
jgi:hypothetical protein